MIPVGTPSIIGLLDYLHREHPQIERLRDLDDKQLMELIRQFQTRRGEFDADDQWIPFVFGRAAAIATWRGSRRTRRLASYMSNPDDPEADLLWRYKHTPNRGIVFFTSEEAHLRDYIEQHWNALHEKSADDLDLYDYTIAASNSAQYVRSGAIRLDDFDHGSFAKHFLARMRLLDPKKLLELIEGAGLPCILIWSDKEQVCVPFIDVLDDDVATKERFAFVLRICREGPIGLEAVDALRFVGQFDPTNLTTSMPPQVPCDFFVSYSRADQDAIGRIVSAATGRAMYPWWDREIPYGDLWRTRLKTQISASEILTVFWSKSSARSTYVHAELDAAIKLGKPILPLSLDGTLPPAPYDSFHVAALPDAQTSEALSAIADKLGSRTAFLNQRVQEVRNRMWIDEAIKLLAGAPESGFVHGLRRAGLAVGVQDLPTVALMVRRLSKASQRIWHGMSASEATLAKLVADAESLAAMLVGPSPVSADVMAISKVSSDYFRDIMSLSAQEKIEHRQKIQLATGNFFDSLSQLFPDAESMRTMFSIGDWG